MLCHYAVIKGLLEDKKLLFESAKNNPKDITNEIKTRAFAICNAVRDMDCLFDRVRVGKKGLWFVFEFSNRDIDSYRVYVAENKPHFELLYGVLITKLRGLHRSLLSITKVAEGIVECHDREAKDKK